MNYKRKFKIIDWCHNEMFNGQLFDSLEDAWEHIYMNIADTDNAYDDYYVVCA